MTRVLNLKRIANLLLIFFLIPTGLGLSGTVAAQPAIFVYANGVRLAANVPLPIFKVNSIDVTDATTTALSQSFSEIAINMQPQSDTYLGHTRYTLGNEKTFTVLEQYGATGGFYAFNPSRAFGDGQNSGVTLDKARAQLQACQFLYAHVKELVPGDPELSIPGISVNCVNDFAQNPLYQVSTEFLTSQSALPAVQPQAADIPLRMMVILPIILQTKQFSDGAPDIPLGGPGGHVSMIFDDTTQSPNNPGPSLDSTVVGLQAVAMPAYGRSFSFIRNVPAVDPAVAQEQVLAEVRAAYPNATNINVPTPSLVFYLSDAAQSQRAMEPKLVFSGVTLDVDGHTLNLKDLLLPAVDAGPNGVGPTVTILSPAEGAFDTPGKVFDLVGSIQDGVAPYHYDWQLDDGTSLGGGIANQAGKLPAVQTVLPLPASKGAIGSLDVHLFVTDGEGITREALVSLDTPIMTFLPAVQKGATPAAPGSTVTSSASDIQSPATLNYRFGVEYGSDYPPYGSGGPDLSGVPPDANGLSSGLIGLGWPRVFNWYNALSWERDWRDCTLGGSDCTYGVDRADFVYYAGHGSNGGIAVPSTSHDSGWFDGSNARYQNARWVGFSSCLTLRAQWPTPADAPIRRWFNAFQGAHMLLGFNSLMADVAFGPRLVDNMRLPTFFFIEFPWMQRTIAEAWVQTAFQMNAGKPAYIYATSATVNPVGNKLPKVTDPPLPRPYPVNWYYWVWWDE